MMQYSQDYSRYDDNMRQIELFDSGPSAKRYRILNDRATVTEDPHFYRQQQYGQSLRNLDIDAFEGRGREHFNASDEQQRFGDAVVIGAKRGHFAIPPGYGPDYMGRGIAAGSDRSGGIDDLDMAEKYCRDLYRAEDEEAARRKALIRAEMDKIYSTRATVYPSDRTMEDDFYQQRSAAGITARDQMRIRSIPPTGESIAAAELRSLLAAGRISSATAAEVLSGQRERNQGPYMYNQGITAARMSTEFGFGNRDSRLYGIPSQGYDQPEIRKSKRNRNEKKPIISSAKPSETFSTASGTRKRSLGGGLLIKSQTQVSVVEKASGTKAAPKNVPSGKVFSKNELEEIEKRRHGAELRQLLSAPENAEVWVKTCTNEVRVVKQKAKTVTTKYFYNAITGEMLLSAPTNPTKDGAPVHIVMQEDLAQILTKTVPATMTLKRTIKGLTDGMLRSHFEQFGKVTMAKVMRIKRRIGKGGKPRRTTALVRMDTLDGQEKVLACTEHIIAEQRTELQICQNRLFVGRLPDKCVPSELISLFSGKAEQIDSSGAAVATDAYLCTPFPQFGFVTLGGRLITEKLSRTGDLLYKGRFYLNVCLVGIELDADATEVFNRKLNEFEEKSNSNRKRKMPLMLQSLQSVREFVRASMAFISERKEQNRPLTLRSILFRLNNGIFSRCTEEEMRSYHTAMDLILEMCLDLGNKLGILADPAEFHSYLNAGTLTDEQQKADGEEDEQKQTDANQSIEAEGDVDGVDEMNEASKVKEGGCESIEPSNEDD